MKPSDQRSSEEAKGVIRRVARRHKQVIVINAGACRLHAPHSNLCCPGRPLYFSNAKCPRVINPNVLSLFHLNAIVSTGVWMEGQVKWHKTTLGHSPVHLASCHNYSSVLSVGGVNPPCSSLHHIESPHVGDDKAASHEGLWRASSRTSRVCAVLSHIIEWSLVTPFEDISNLSFIHTHIYIYI